jgi:hypothetical protein
MGSSYLGVRSAAETAPPRPERTHPQVDQVDHHHEQVGALHQAVGQGIPQGLDVQAQADAQSHVAWDQASVDNEGGRGQVALVKEQQHCHQQQAGGHPGESKTSTCITDGDHCPAPSDPNLSGTVHFSADGYNLSPGKTGHRATVNRAAAGRRPGAAKTAPKARPYRDRSASRLPLHW